MPEEKKCWYWLHQKQWKQQIPWKWYFRQRSSAGTVKQTDSQMGLTVICADVSSLEDVQYEKIKPVKLGNSYSSRQGDLVFTVGSPAGMVHSSSYGFIPI